MSSDLTSDQAATFLGIRSLYTVRSWLEGGTFPGAYIDSDGDWRFSRESLEEVLDHMRSTEQQQRTTVEKIITE